MAQIKVVTDSTADLSEPIRQKLGIEMIPLNVHFGDEMYKDQVELPPEEFYRKLRAAKILPRTSQPSPGSLWNFIRGLAKERIL